MTKILISPYSRQLEKNARNPKNYPHFQDLIDLLKQNNCYVTQVGQGSEEIFPNVNDYIFNARLKDLKEKIISYDFWISVDNFFHHLGASVGKRGVTIWGKSDPEIFGYEMNLNILKDRKFLRSQQFWLWSQTEYDENVFLPAQEVFDIMLADGILKIK